jgi:hypothetical protein
VTTVADTEVRKKRWIVDVNVYTSRDSMSISADLVVSMLALRREGRTGVATIENDGVRTFVYLRDGVVVFAEEGTQGETLGRLLVRQQLLSQERYVEIIGKMTDAFFLNEQLRFGEVAVELGYLTEAQVEKALRDQIRWKVVRAFQRRGSTWMFEDSISRVEDAGHFPMPLESLVLEVVRWVDDDEKMDLGLGRMMDKALTVLPESAATVGESFGLDAAERAFAARVDGTRTTRELLAEKNADDVDMHAVLTAMIVARVAVVPKAAPVPGKPAAAMPLIPTPIAFPIVIPTPKEFPVAKLPPVAPAAPVAAPKPAAAPARQMARLPVTRTSEILEALNAQRTKVEPQRTPNTLHEAKLLAERSFQAGLEHMRSGRYSAALEELHKAVLMMPASFEYRLYQKWCALRTRGEPPHGIDLAELRRLSTSALANDPNFAFAYCVAGEIALGEGLDKQALKMLTRATKLDPGLLEAQRLLRVLERRTAAGKA